MGNVARKDRKKSVDLITDREYSHKGNYVCAMKKAELYETCKELISQNRALTHNLKMQLELSKERLFGADAQLKELHTSKLWEQLGHKVRV